MTERSQLAESTARIRNIALVLLVHREPARLAEAAGQALQPRPQQGLNPAGR